MAQSFAVMRSRIYFNLHKKLLSVQHKVNGRWKVVKHVDSITLRDVKFKVSQAGRERVLREKRKNVHAFLEGEEISEIPICQFKITYNPYKYKTFVINDGSEKPIDKAAFVIVNRRDILATQIK